MAYLRGPQKPATVEGHTVQELLTFHTDPKRQNVLLLFIPTKHLKVIVLIRHL